MRHAWESPGHLVDPKSSQAVLRVLSQALDEHAAEMEKVVAKLRELQQMQESMNRGDEDLRYIG